MPRMTKMEAVLKYGAHLAYEDADGVWFSNEWLVGTFAGGAEVAPTLEEAAQKVIGYFDQHIGHNSFVGGLLADARWESGPTVDLDESELVLQPQNAEQ